MLTVTDMLSQQISDNVSQLIALSDCEKLTISTQSLYNSIEKKIKIIDKLNKKTEMLILRNLETGI